jgi:hypothetical protein
MSEKKKPEQNPASKSTSKSTSKYKFEHESFADQYLTDSKFNNWKDAYKEYSGTGGGKDRRDFKKAWYDTDYLSRRYGDVYKERREAAIKEQYGV